MIGDIHYLDDETQKQVCVCLHVVSCALAPPSILMGAASHVTHMRLRRISIH